MHLFDTLLASLKGPRVRSPVAAKAKQSRLVAPGGTGVPFVEAKSLNDVTQSAMRKSSSSRRLR